MVIAGSDIAMASARSFVEREESRNELQVWLGQRPAQNAREGAPRPARPTADTLEISDAARARFEAMKKRHAAHGSRRREIDLPGGLDNKDFIKKLLIEALTGRKINIRDVRKASPEETQAASAPEGEPAQQQADWSMEYKETAVTAALEKTAYTAAGTIRTADGAEVSFSLELNMTRASVTSTETTLRAGNAVDPLVVNYGGNAAELTSARFSFDLDSDGANELIPFAGAGSGFLAIDLNGDNIVNNGSELFGPATGDGFGELAAHDTDGNSWIDEADAAYNSLFVWTKDSSGADSLRSLREMNIGAIYLASAETAFEVRDPGNALNGQVRRTGIFLSEDLAPGTVQQIDLVV